MTRDYTKFYTPKITADFMAGLLRPEPFDQIVDPHAGNGALLEAVKRRCPKAHTCAIEINSKEIVNLRANHIIIADFLTTDIQIRFNGCIANPPFGNGINLEMHLGKMMEIVKHKGRIVTILPRAFKLPFEHDSMDIDNWAQNSDGSSTEIKIVSFLNPMKS